MADSQFEIAIIGGGLVGLQIAAGLLRRGIPVTVYEQALTRREIGAGIGFTHQTMKTLELLSPVVFEALMGVSAVVGQDAEADAVIGCDGIKSRVRADLLGADLLGADHPAASPGYSGWSVYRAVVPMDRAKAMLGGTRAADGLYEMGPDAHLVHYPLAGGTLMNAVAYVYDSEVWTGGDGKLTAEGAREDVARAFGGWGPEVCELVGCMPEKPERWGLFDSAEHPLDTFAYGRVCLAGDAAHATTPHLGLGVAMGIADGLVLGTVLERAKQLAMSTDNIHSVNDLLTAAFKVFDGVCRERSQWIVQCSRSVGSTLSWRNPEVGRDSDKILEDFEWRFAEAWKMDGQALIDQSLRDLKAALPAISVTISGRA